MYAAGQQLNTRLQSAKLSNVMANNRRTLEAARRHTTEEVQGLRASLEKAQKELEEQRLVHVGQQRTSTQVEEEQQEQLTALERARDDAIDSLNDLREDLDRSSSRIQVQSETIEGLRRQLDDARNTIRATERFRHHAQDMSEEIFSLREQLNLVTAAAEAADRELAERELTRNNDEQVIAERDRACADRDAARLASETANREASITKRQRDEYMSLLAAESARLVQVQQELQQARESEANPRDEAVEAPSKKPRHDENSRKAPILAAVSHKDDRCNGCGHTGHIRRNCRYSKFPDFNAEGPWEGSETYKKIEARMQKEGTPDEYPVLPRHGGPPNYDKRERREDKKNKDRERRPHADSIDRGKKRDRSPLRRGRRLRLLGVSTDPLTRLIARPLDAVVSAYDLLCSHARHNLPAPYVNATILI